MSTGPLLTSPLVSTQWLADHLGADNLVVLDATVLPFTQPNGRPGYVSGHEQYIIDGHIPGAIFADLVEVFSDPNGKHTFTRPSAELFAIAAGSVGVSNDSTVVVYDNVLNQWASRIWWLFRSFGYDNVAVLDGGLAKWRAEERETDIGHVEPTVATFDVTERPELWVDKSFVQSVIAGDAEATLVCALSNAEFTGEAGHRSRLGHIPGSVNAPFGQLLERGTNTFRSVDALRASLASLLESDRVVNYCAGGIASAAEALALTLLGHRNVAIYDGSLNEWVADPATPVVTGA